MGSVAAAEAKTQKSLQKASKMIHLGIWLTNTAGECFQVGETVCDGDRGAFKYDEGYLERPDAFPLDPVSFPLEVKEWSYNRKHGVAAVFEDSLPDDWGRRLLVRKARLLAHEQTLPRLLEALGSAGLGALSYTTVGAPTPPPQLPRLTSVERLMAAASRFEEGVRDDDAELLELYNAGSSPGGARPKVLLLDGDIPAIAKFPSRKDSFDMIALEAGTMALAGKAGVTTPLTRVQTVGNKKALIVHRFDVTGSGRKHTISLQTLLRAEGYYNASYEDLFGLVRRVSYQPEIDIPALYRQATFNLLVGNTDDHLKNFSMLHDGQGYRLTPAYDLLPNTGDKIEHTLSMRHSNVYQGRRVLIEFGKTVGVNSPAAIVDDVSGVVATFRKELEEQGVTKEEAGRFWNYDVSKHLGKP